MFFPICIKCLEETLFFSSFHHIKGQIFYVQKSWKIAERLYMMCILCVTLSPTVENPSHSDFVHLRNMLIRTNMQDLKHTTHYVLYENYRINCLCKDPCLVNKKIKLYIL